MMIVKKKKVINYEREKVTEIKTNPRRILGKRENMKFKEETDICAGFVSSKVSGGTL